MQRLYQDVLLFSGAARHARGLVFSFQNGTLLRR